jgi:hypothetical protein
MNHNTSSRFAAMGAFCSTGHFEITPYLSATDDWSRTPDGRTYSNKAPGGMILGLPLYCAALEVQKVLTPSPPDVATRVKNEWKLRYVLNLLMCLIVQMIPWVWICLRWERKLAVLGASSEARLFAMLALLFGTTPAILMDIWIGHPTVAFFSMLALLAIVEGRAVLLGLAFGMMQLTEYSSLLLLPAALFAFPGIRKNWLRILPEILLGALIPAVLWIIYHQMTFGSAFAIANRYINPMFQDQAGAHLQLWGIFTLPDPWILVRLILGWWRGILFSQPWVLVAMITLPFVPQSAVSRRTLIYCEAGLILLLIMNASFGGWHGGATAGPRYLSAALPAFAIPVALVWDRLSGVLKKILWLTLGFSCLVFALAKVFSPTSGLWPEWIGYVQDKPWEFVWKFTAEIAIVWLLTSKTIRIKNSI